MIVANQKYKSQQIQERVVSVLGAAPRQQKVADLLLRLRAEKRN